MKAFGPKVRSTRVTWHGEVPTITVDEVDSVAAPFLIASGDLQDPKVLEAYAMAVLAGAKNYFNNTYLTEMLVRMRATQIFDPLYAKGKPVADADVYALSTFNFYKKPVLVPEFARMKLELSKYNELTKQIPDREVRNDAKDKGNFDIRRWWATVKAQLPRMGPRLASPPGALAKSVPAGASLQHPERHLR